VNSSGVYDAEEAQIECVSHTDLMKD